MKILFFLLISLPVFAIPEESYERIWNTQVLSYYQNLDHGQFVNAQGLKISYHFRTSSAASKTLVILPGRTEPSIKYAEIIFDLQSPDLNVFILDHQGQGESDHLLSGDKGHVRFFNDYVSDLSQFMSEIVLAQTKQTEYLLLAHSMGGLIATHYLAKHPKIFSKAVLSAPMFKLNTNPYSEKIALLYARALFLFGKGAAYAPGRGPYRPEDDRFETNVVTHSKVRFETNKGFFVSYPNLIVGGPTVRWIKESIISSKRTLKLAEKIKTPLLIFQASKDEIVINSRQTEFCTRVAGCEITMLIGAHHEILAEKDVIRNKALICVKRFLDI